MKTLLILEDNDQRMAAFNLAVRELGEGWQARVWRDAPTMISECEDYFEDAHLISLDHDLNRDAGATRDPGTGLEVAQLLAGRFFRARYPLSQRRRCRHDRGCRCRRDGVAIACR